MSASTNVNQTTIPLSIAKETGQERSIDQIQTMPELLRYLANHLVGNAGPILNSIDSNRVIEIVTAATESGGCGAGVIQFVAGDPCHISYGNCKIYPYPPNVPLVYVGSDKPSFLTALTPVQVAAYGLTPQDSNSEGCWVIFTP